MSEIEDVENLAKQYRTKDIAFAAFLKVAGAKMLRTEKDGELDTKSRKKYCTFVFEDRGNMIEELKQAYFAGSDKSKVPARMLMDQFKAFRSIGYENSI